VEVVLTLYPLAGRTLLCPMDIVDMQISSADVAHHALLSRRRRSKVAVVLQSTDTEMDTDANTDTESKHR